MNNKTDRIWKPQRDARLKAVQLTREMIEYRNGEISALSWNLKRGIIRLHRERSSKQHIEQYKELKGIIDQISRHISDNDYDINHLQIFLTQTPEKAIYPTDTERTETSNAIHYIQ
jgi:hypothetical protein